MVISPEEQLPIFLRYVLQKSVGDKGILDNIEATLFLN